MLQFVKGRKMENNEPIRDQEIEIDLSNEAAGIYILELSDGIKMHQFKFIKEE